MNNTLSTLKNINFWGILISNLIVGNLILAIKYINSEFVTLSISFSISAIVVYFILFCKLNFSKSNKLILLLFAFISCIIVFLIIMIIVCFIMAIEGIIEGGIIDDPKIIPQFIAMLMFFIVMVGTFVILPVSLLFTAINFIWLYKEKIDTKKKNMEIEQNNENLITNQQ